MNDIKFNIKNAISDFNKKNPTDAALELFSALGYKNRIENHLVNKNFDEFQDFFAKDNPSFRKDKAKTEDWTHIDMLFQITKENIKTENQHFEAKLVDNTIIESYIFFVIELKNSDYNRSSLAAITREINKLFRMPAMILFKYGSKLTFSIINRRINERDENKDVLKKVTLIKDIDIEKTHRAHIEILFDLSLQQIRNIYNVTNFIELHNAWQKILDTKELNKRFYLEIANWYFWALDNVEFPKGAGDEKEVRNATSLIRLLTRLIFVWFLKEKHLVPYELFDIKYLDTVLDYKDKTGSTYYKAILQNLFFATLNTAMKKDDTKSRIFIDDAKSKGFFSDGYLQSGYFRYKRFIKKADLLIEKFSSIPFLNGGLFECLDKRIEEQEIRIDCFSDNSRNEDKLKVPDDLFFGIEKKVDLNKIYDTKNKEYKTRGLINILNSYKFTVAENTPIEEEIALDPELLGRVFENLLASYNPETGTTARKATGSFYTPREIVNYMVDESIIEYLQGKLESAQTGMSMLPNVNTNQKVEQTFLSVNESGNTNQNGNTQTGMSMLPNQEVNTNQKVEQTFLSVTESGNQNTNQNTQTGMSMLPNVNTNQKVEQTFLSVNESGNTNQNGNTQTGMSMLPNQNGNTQTGMSMLPNVNTNQKVEQTFLSVNESGNTNQNGNTQTGMSMLPNVNINQKVEQTFLSVNHYKENQSNRLIIKKRNLPHWTYDGSYYFITFRVLNDDSLNEIEQKITFEHILEGNNKFYHLVALVIMPDHVHIILKPNNDYNLSRIMKGIKGVTAHLINKKFGKTGNVWQPESFDRIIRNDKELFEKVNYMFNNPYKKEICKFPDAYNFWFINDNYDFYLENEVEQTFLSVNESGNTNQNGNTQTGMSMLPNQNGNTQTGMSMLPNVNTNQKVEQTFLSVNESENQNTNQKTQTGMSMLPNQNGNTQTGMSMLPNVNTNQKVEQTFLSVNESGNTNQNGNTQTGMSMLPNQNTQTGMSMLPNVNTNQKVEQTFLSVNESGNTNQNGNTQTGMSMLPNQKTQTGMSMLPNVNTNQKVEQTFLSVNESGNTNTNQNTQTGMSMLPNQKTQTGMSMLPNVNTNQKVEQTFLSVNESGNTNTNQNTQTGMSMLPNRNTQTGMSMLPNVNTNQKVEQTFQSVNESGNTNQNGNTQTGMSMLPNQKTQTGMSMLPLNERLRQLLSYTDEPHLFNDEETNIIINAIDNLKILDPACGSGAFPMGVLYKLVHILHKIDPDNHIWKQKLIDKTPTEIRVETKNALANKPLDYIRKLGLIESCIYGVDIQPIAIQISKLRFFISLIVEQKIDDSKENRDIKPLPNLETKFVAANTLIALEKPNDTLAGEVKVIKEAEELLLKIRKDIFYVNSSSKKKDLAKKEKEARKNLKNLLESNGGFGHATAEQIADWDPFNQNASSGWFDPEFMFGIKVGLASLPDNSKNTNQNDYQSSRQSRMIDPPSSGFDIVIGNPPYVKEYTKREAFNGLRNSQYYQGKMDLWYMFACVSLDLLEKNGILCFIAQNNWVTSYGASKMRNKVISDARIKELIDFGPYMVFESADIQTMIMLFQKDKISDNYQFEIRRLKGINLNFQDLKNILTLNVDNKIETIKPIINRKDFFDKELTFSNYTITEILNKINNNSNFYLNDKEIANGIHPHFDFVNKKIAIKHNNLFRIGEGIFGLSSIELNNLNLSEIEKTLIKPYYNSSDKIKRYYIDSKNDFWLIYTNSEFKDPKKIEPYTKIKSHLDRFKNVITSDNKPYGLHRAREERFFKGEKIISLRKCANKPIFVYADFDTYVSATFYVIKSDRINLKYLTGILNSKVVEFWLKNKGKMQGDIFQVDKAPLLNIPIYKPEQIAQLPFIEKVNQILSAKERGEDSSDLEREIDAMVYKLYELTYDEVKIVEPEFKLTVEEYNNYKIME